VDEERRDEDSQRADAQSESPLRDAGLPDQLGSAPRYDYDAVQRTNRRRLALLGLATGAVMALIVLCCVLLLMLLVS
jgi:hypothetical protein